MEASKIGVSILAILAVLTVTALVLVYNNPTSAAVYEQPYSNKPAFLQPGQYLEDGDLCSQYSCYYPVDDYYRETERAFQIGYAELAFPHREPNIRCGCSDGRSFIIRPDLILEETY